MASKIIKEEKEITQEQHTEIIRLLTKLNERQITLFNNMKRIDSHLARQNSKVEQSTVMALLEWWPIPFNRFNIVLWYTNATAVHDA